MGKVTSSLTGGKGGSKTAAPAQAAPTVINNSNPAMDAYLADQANANQMAMQQQQLNAQAMQAQQAPQQQPQGDPGLRPAQQQEQNDPYALSDVWATLDALRGN